MSEVDELRSVIDRIVQSKSRKKIIVSGPGTGKTTLFKQLLEISSGDPKDKLVLTFINTLKNDLEKELSDKAGVYTLHSFCLYMLHRNANFRGYLSENFICFPGISTLISEDWEILEISESPQFVKEMRNLDQPNHIGFFLARGNYYDAVDFDDTVFRTLDSVLSGRSNLDRYEMVLVDEYQDFNRMEASIIEALSQNSAIVIAGDDDQALYGQLRDSSWDFIRGLCSNGDYEVFELPFCMRCSKVVVDAINDIIIQAKRLRKLTGRIDKPFRYFPLVKEEDSLRYPKINLVTTSVQRENANYMGKYISQAIKLIPKNEIDDAIKGNYPAVLIIVSKPYRDQIASYLTTAGYILDQRPEPEIRITRNRGLLLVQENIRSNLGWRIILRDEPSEFITTVIERTRDASTCIFDILPVEYRDRILREIKETPPIVRIAEEVEIQEPIIPIRITSFEGAKGLSAQHVFVVGLHNNELPRDITNIRDIEICKLIVGLSRTRKLCTIINTTRFADQPKRASIFLDWILRSRFQQKQVNAAYWKRVDEEGT